MRSDRNRRSMARIHLLATGGTIAGTQRTAMKAGYRAAGIDIDELLANVPHVSSLAKLSAEQISSIGSQDMTDALWLRLSKRINTLLGSSTIDGVVVVHGTDTMEETAYFLDLTVKSLKPVVLVGAMRPATAVSADGPANLYSAVLVAASKQAKGRGVLVCFNTQLHHARSVVKADATSLQSFSSSRRGLAGVVHTERIEWLDTGARRRTAKAAFDIARLTELPRVDILYAHAGMNADLIVSAVALGARGIVIAGVGSGNMSKAAIEILSKAARDGVVVVRSTRLQNGSVLRNMEINDDACGFVASGDLNAAKSRVLLQLALTKTSEPARIQRIFDTH